MCKYPCRWMALAKKMSKMREAPFYVPCAAPMPAGSLAAACLSEDGCSHPSIPFHTHRQTSLPTLPQEQRVAQSGLPSRHCSPSSNMTKTEEGHMFMLDLKLAPHLPQDQRISHVGFWPALYGLDLYINECQGYFTCLNTLCIMSIGCRYCSCILGYMLLHLPLSVVYRT